MYTLNYSDINSQTAENIVQTFSQDIGTTAFSFCTEGIISAILI